MSRGGFRGRGRGGGRGGMPTIPGMSHETYREIMSGPSQHTGKLYPPLDNDSVAFLPKPSEAEDIMIRKETELDDLLRKGLVVDEENGTRWCGWRLPEIRKTVGIEIETWSDRLAGPTAASPQEDQLDPVKLKLDQRFFPPSLWDAYFAPEQGLKRAKAKAGQAKKRKRILDSDDDEKPDADGADKSSNASEDEDEDYTDESDHQDYDANYFDNGEGDDDEGGEDEDGGGGNYDD